MRKTRITPRIATLAMVLAASAFLAVELCAQDIEPNDTTGSAQPLNSPFSLTGGSISSKYDVDYYSFVGEANRETTIWLELTDPEGTFEPTLAVYDREGNLLAYNEGEYNLATREFGRDPILYLRLPRDGTYYIGITSAAAFHKRQMVSVGVAGSYTLRLFSYFDSTAIGDRYELNDSRQTAFAVTLPFRSHGSHLMYLGDMDWYSFSATKGERISVDVDALEPIVPSQGPPLVAARVGVFDDSGRLIATSDTNPDPDTGFSSDPALQFNVPKTGKYYVAVTPKGDSDFTTLFGSAEFLADPRVSSAAHTIGYYELRLRSMQDLYFPQAAAGNFGSASFTTSFLLVNTTAQEAGGYVELFRSDGSPMESAFLSGETGSSKRYFTIPPKGGVRVRTDGVGEGVSGYAVVNSTVGVGGSVVFSQWNAKGELVTEAGVGTPAPVDFFVIPVEVLGPVNTGIAIANISGPARANLSFKLVDSSGKAVSTRTLVLQPGEHIASFVGGPGQLFPTATNFRGSLQVVSDLPVYTVALRTSDSTLTTLPASKTNQPFEANTISFPHVVVGGQSPAYRSTLTLTNPWYFPTSGTVRYTRSDGSALRVSTGGIEGSLVSFKVPPQGTVVIESKGSDTLEQGFATVTSDHGLGGVLIISQRDPASGNVVAEVGVAPSETASNFFIFAENSDGYSTGIATANTDSSAAQLVYHLHPLDGTAVSTGPRTLGAGKQVAELVAGADQLFPEFTGTAALEVESSVPVPAIALRITATTMTSLPVIRVR